MPSASRIVICAAGGGKTTRIVNQVISETSAPTLVVTYTRNNEKEIRRGFSQHGPVVPAHAEVMTWFAFLLRELARPYRRAMHSQRVDGILWVDGRSAQYVAETKVARHYFADGRYVYSDKIAKFICACDLETKGAIMSRLSQRFSHVFIDEMQDLAGYDLDLVERMLNAGIRLTMVGDHRQATYKTNQSPKNKSFAGIRIIDKLRAWDKSKLAVLEEEGTTYRCHQHIADLGDTLFPSEKTTTSRNGAITGHDGVFVVRSTQVRDYVATYRPQTLRYDKTTECLGLEALNFGESKGMTFGRVLIFPNKGAAKWLSTGSISHIERSLAKMYVGVTRGRHSLAFVHDGKVGIKTDGVIG